MAGPVSKVANYHRAKSPHILWSLCLLAFCFFGFHLNWPFALFRTGHENSRCSERGAPALIFKGKLLKRNYNYRHKPKWHKLNSKSWGWWCNYVPVNASITGPQSPVVCHGPVYKAGKPKDEREMNFKGIHTPMHGENKELWCPIWRSNFLMRVGRSARETLKNIKTVGSFYSIYTACLKHVLR